MPFCHLPLSCGEEKKERNFDLPLDHNLQTPDLSMPRVFDPRTYRLNYPPMSSDSQRLDPHHVHMTPTPPHNLTSHLRREPDGNAGNPLRRVPGPSQPGQP
jgi:hypothetical protein